MKSQRCSHSVLRFVAVLIVAWSHVAFGGGIYDAAQKGDIATITSLIGQGADINAKDEQGGTPLLYAVIRSQKATVDFLLSNGAKTEIGSSDGTTPLMLAARYGESEIASNLVLRGAQVDARSNGRTPLQLAAKYGFPEIVHLLVEHGANVNLSDDDGITPLILAVATGNVSIVDYLLSKAADANVVTKNAGPLRTALVTAAWNRYSDEAKYGAIIKTLVSHGAKDSWLSQVPGFDPEQLSGLMLKQGPDGKVMSGSLPFFLGHYVATRPWKDPSSLPKSVGGNNFFVWEKPPAADKSVTLIVVEDQNGNKTAAAAVLPAFIGEGGVIYNDGVSAVGKDGPFAKLQIIWHDDNSRPVSGQHILLTRETGTTDLTTDESGAAMCLLKQVTANEPVSVTFNSKNETPGKAEFDCVIRGASESSVQFVISKGK